MAFAKHNVPALRILVIQSFILLVFCIHLTNNTCFVPTTEVILPLWYVLHATKLSFLANQNVEELSLLQSKMCLHFVV